jgi:hypothetical protein
MNLMQSVTFLNSVFLFGLLAVAVPIIIHLVSRLRYVEMDYSSLLFLQYHSRRTSRKIQLLNVLLLLARIALLAAFTLALARPSVLRSQPTAARGESATVIIMDNSYSMGYSTGNQTSLDRAKRAACQFIEAMRDGDSASVLVMSDRSSFLFKEPVHDKEVLLRAVKGVPVSNRGTDVLPALLEACQALQSAEVARRQVLLFTDMQRNGWVRSDSAHASLGRKLNELLAALRGEGSGIPLYLFNSGPDRYRNLAVSAVELQDQIISTGVPFEVLGSVLVSGSYPEGQKVDAALHVGNQPVRKASVLLSGACAVAAEFAANLPAAGWCEAWIELPSDDLPVDNRFHALIPVAEPVRVLLVRRPPGERLDSGTALALALRSQGEQSGFLRLRETTGGDFQPSLLEEADVVVLAGQCPGLKADSLTGFVGAGGGLLVFPDAGTAWLNENLTGESELLPGRFLDDVAVPAGTSTRIHSVDYRHPAMRFFESHPSCLSAVRLQRFTPLELSGGAGIRGSASDGAGRVLFAERRLGKGMVLAFGFGCGLEWGNTPLTAALVPLLGEAILHVAGRREADVSSHQAGSVIRQSLPGEGWDVSVRGPQGATVRVQTDSKGGETWYELTDTEAPGIYTVRAESPSETRTDRFVVNLNTAESMLMPASTADVAGILPGAEIRFALPGDAPAILSAKTERVMLWDTFLLLAALLIVAEGYLAARVYRGEEAGLGPAVTP